MSLVVLWLRQKLELMVLVGVLALRMSWSRNRGYLRQEQSERLLLLSLMLLLPLKVLLVLLPLHLLSWWRPGRKETQGIRHRRKSWRSRQGRQGRQGGHARNLLQLSALEIRQFPLGLPLQQRRLRLAIASRKDLGWRG